VRIPSEIEGVITVTANGNTRRKAFYSNYGVAVTNVVAPGGDSRQLTPEAPNGRVLSTWPGTGGGVSFLVVDPTAPPGTLYRYLQGTSMAAPPASRAAALIISRFGDLQNPQNGKMRPQQVQAYLEHTALPLACDEPACYGGPGYNAYYGHGEVDALAAVTHDTSNPLRQGGGAGACRPLRQRRRPTDGSPRARTAISSWVGSTVRAATRAPRAARRPRRSASRRPC
jgi:subtilisin family serine protease